MWVTLGNWIAALIDGIVTMANLLANRSQDDKLAMILTSLYEIQERVHYTQWSVGAAQDPEYFLPDVLGNAGYGLEAIKDMTDLGTGYALTAADNGVAAIARLDLILDRIAPGEAPPPITTRQDTALLLGAIYTVFKKSFEALSAADVASILASIESSRSSVIADVDTKAGEMTGAINGNVDYQVGGLAEWLSDKLPVDLTGLGTSIEGAVTTLTGEIGEAQQAIIDALGNIEPPSNGPPVWPGLANVTLGDPVALSDQLVLNGPMDGVLINVTTPPSKVGVYRIGERYYDYKVGELTFETDNGETESFQYLGFRQAIYTPRTMQRAAKCRFRVLAGAEGSATLWTKT